MRQTTASIQRAMARQEGFTLLELMVTLVVSSLVVLAAYQIFASTSEAMYEANSLSDTTDRARFGLELIARDVRAAGAFGSPDSPSDPFVNQAQLDLRRVRGLYAYDGHYNRQAGDFQTLWNQATRSDSIVLLGAYDFPFSFEVRFPNGDMGDFNQAFSPNTERGALRFLSLDPFVMALNTTQDIGPLTRALMGPGPADDRLIRSRVLRVMDRNGFSQFASIDSATYTPGVNEGLRMALTPGPGALRAKVGDERAGLEPGGEEDVGYEAALLDAYRYRVCFTSAGNLHLVKERLNADLLLDHIELAISDDCSVDPVGPNEQIVERTVLVDRVVDFRVWYDCAPMGQATLVDATWATGWMVPTPASATAGHACAYLDRSTGAPMARQQPSPGAHGPHSPLGAHRAGARRHAQLRLLAR